MDSIQTHEEQYIELNKEYDYIVFETSMANYVFHNTYNISLLLKYNIIAIIGENIYRESHINDQGTAMQHVVYVKSEAIFYGSEEDTKYIYSNIQTKQCFVFKNFSFMKVLKLVPLFEEIFDDDNDNHITNVTLRDNVLYIS